MFIIHLLLRYILFYHILYTRYKRSKTTPKINVRYFFYSYIVTLQLVSIKIIISKL